MKAVEFKVGDRVQQVYGGRKGTVSEVGNSQGDVVVAWDTGEIYQSAFSPSELIKIHN